MGKPRFPHKGKRGCWLVGLVLLGEGGEVDGSEDESHEAEEEDEQQGCLNGSLCDGQGGESEECEGDEGEDQGGDRIGELLQGLAFRLGGFLFPSLCFNSIGGSVRMQAESQNFLENFWGLSYRCLKIGQPRSP